MKPVKPNSDMTAAGYDIPGKAVSSNPDRFSSGWPPTTPVTPDFCKDWTYVMDVNPDHFIPGYYCFLVLEKNGKRVMTSHDSQIRTWADFAKSINWFVAEYSPYFTFAKLIIENE